MRKDEIEEQIIRIEKSLRELQAGQRETSDTIREEIRSFQSLVIEEKIEAMRQQAGYTVPADSFSISSSPEYSANSKRPSRIPARVQDRRECIDFFLERLKEIGDRMDPDEARPVHNSPEKTGRRALCPSTPEHGGRTL